MLRYTINLKYKIWSFFPILLILSGNSLPINSSNEIDSLITNKEISTDYFKQLPSNDYIIGSWDAFDKRRFKISRRSKRVSSNNSILRNGDLLVVKDNFLTISNEILSDITKPFVGIFSTYDLFKAIND